MSLQHTFQTWRAATLSAVLVLGFAIPAASAAYVDPPSLAEQIKSGALPPIEKRLPEKPRVINLTGDLKPGKHGGDIRTIIGRTRDIRLMVVYGYARIVTYNDKFQLEPDLVESYEVKDDRSFTFHLRKGHKWSDGAPFTAEDFRYWWEDVANNKDLNPSGPPIEMLVDDEPPKVEIIDEATVRFSWSKPNPFFLPRLAGASPLFPFRPSHHLKKFHIKYTSEEELTKTLGASRNWAAAHNREDNLYEFDNPALPTLQPWMNVTKMPATRFRVVRNPYFHRVDQNGLQLPYIDTVVVSVASAQLIAAKAGAGEADLQVRNIAFNNFTFLKQGEQRNNYKTLLWKEAKGSHMALFPNMSIKDPEWRKLFRDARFRRALSLGIDRELINETLFFGLAFPANNTVLPQSPLFKKDYQTKWIKFDIRAANALLDEMGLKREGGVRRLPDGRPIEIIIETAGENQEEVDVLELVKDNWAKIGVKLFIKPSQREVFRNRIFAGETQMSVWTGWENGVPTSDFSPLELAPTSQHQYQWPMWGQYRETKGQSGEPIDMDIAKQLDALFDAWMVADTDEKRSDIWHKMLAIHADQVFSIGIVSGVLQPVVVRNTLRNVPAEGIYNWDPGSHLGMYKPDTFWLDQ